MKSTIEHTSDGLRIQADVPEDKQRALLEELGKCAAGHCSCPTPQYGKLAAIDLKTTAGGVTVDLKVKPGEEVELDDLRKCLDHTASKVDA